MDILYALVTIHLKLQKKISKEYQTMLIIERGIEKANDDKNKDLKKMLKEKGRQYTLTMCANRKFNMTNKQLEYAMSYCKEVK